MHFLRNHDLKPHVLPVCFFAGKIQRALDEGSADGLSVGVLQEAYLLFLALLTEVGLLSPRAQDSLRKLTLVNTPQNYYHNSVRFSRVHAACCASYLVMCPACAFSQRTAAVVHTVSVHTVPTF